MGFIRIGRYSNNIKTSDLEELGFLKQTALGGHIQCPQCCFFNSNICASVSCDGIMFKNPMGLSTNMTAILDGIDMIRIHE